MDDFIQYWINNNKIFHGCIMILMNLGAKYISQDIPNYIEELFKMKEFRIFFVFCVVFIATRDFKISILIMLIFILIFKFLLNNTSNLCILSEKFSNNLNYKSQHISNKDYDNAIEIIKKYNLNNK
jgi:hypothetical protein